MDQQTGIEARIAALEDIEIPLQDVDNRGSLSNLIETKGVLFRKAEIGRHYDWHNAPRRQFVALLSGGQLEIEVGDGSIRRFGPGDVFLAEDTTGRGHISRSIGNKPRTTLFIVLD